MENKELIRVIERTSRELSVAIRTGNKNSIENSKELRKLLASNHKNMMDLFIKQHKEMAAILIQLGQQIREIKRDVRTFYNDFNFYQQKSNDDGSKNVDPEKAV